MSATPDPWWSSPAQPDGSRPTRLSPDEDPVEAFRAARADTAGDEADGSSADPASGAEPSVGPASRAHADEICGVCPVCLLARTLEETRPELLGHLVQAVRHLAAAARSMLDPPTDDEEDGRGTTGGRPGDPLERIDLE